MRADLLHVIVPVFNPRRFRSHMLNGARFLRHMIESGVRVTVVECTYGEQAPIYADIRGITHVHVSARTVVWIKEQLINIGIARLPRDWRYVAWIDADVEFARADWAEETVHALQHYDFVQPWEHCYDLGPRGEHLELHHSFGRQWIREPHTCTMMGKGGYRFAHPGYAWAATRCALDAVGGLIETAALGAADHHQALAIIGKAHLSIPGGMTPGYAQRVLEWEERARHHVAGNLGYLTGTIRHAFHGRKADRAYISRWDILKRHAFDPIADLKRNTCGVWELTGSKPELRRDIMAYFTDRDEDQTVHGALPA